MQALKLVNTKDLSRDQWLEYRRTGIGGSDVSAICSMNRYRSPMAVYMDKIGSLPPLEDNEYMYWGRVLEDVVAQEFTLRTGYRLRKKNAILRHTKYEFMLANIDREVVGTNAGLECKNANEYAKDEWAAENVPKEYALQCHHYMACTGAQRWYVAVLIGGNKFEWRVIERDETIINSLIDIEYNFWYNHVVPQVPPAFTAYDSTLLSETYPQAKDTFMVDLTKFREDVLGLIGARNALQDAKFSFEDYKNKIKGHMQDADLGYYDGELMFTWKNTKRGRQFKIVGVDE